MKITINLLSVIILSVIISQQSFSQTTETFETESIGSATFTDAGQIFNVTAQNGGPFDVFSY